MWDVRGEMYVNGSALRIINGTRLDTDVAYGFRTLIIRNRKCSYILKVHYY
jgi:hypothetical protein